MQHPLVRRLSRLRWRDIRELLTAQRIDAYFYLGTVESLSLANLEALPLEHYTMHSPSGRPEIDSRLTPWRECYALCDDGEVVHQSWVLRDLILPTRLEICPNLPVIGECTTNPAQRGRHIYARAIRQIALEVMTSSSCMAY